MTAGTPFEMPNCRSCDIPAGIKDPAELVADASKGGAEPYAWPLCRGHEPYALVAGWKVYEATDPEAAHLIDQLRAQEEARP